MPLILNWLIRPRHLLAIVCAVFCVFWFVNGPEILSGTPGSAESKILADFKREHPTASAWVDERNDNFGRFNTAVAIESLHGRTFNPEMLARAVEVRARLTALSRHSGTLDDHVLWSHGTALDAMEDLPEERIDYLNRLEAATTDRDYGSLVRDDPVALTSTLLRDEPRFRDHYRENRDWYHAMMEVLITTIEISPGFTEDSPDLLEHSSGLTESSAGARADEYASATSLIALDDLLIATTDSDGQLIALVSEPLESPVEASLYYATCRQFGRVIAMAAEQGLAAKETADVIILNRDSFPGDPANAGDAALPDPATTAARLVRLYRNRPSVWAAAQQDGFVLSFDQLAPDLAQPVLEKYPDLGVASLIVTQYPDLAIQAAEIVNAYGELGVAVLVQYEGSDKFRQLLESADVDYRIAMVAVLKADVGLEQTLADPSYLNKWVAADGQPLQDEWWVNLPLVGGIAKVAKNRVNQIPSDWSEIGWAAWDVADVGLMVVSLGTSKVVSEAAKQSVKQSAKRVGKTAAQRMSRTGVKATADAARPTAMARFVTAARSSQAIAPIRWTARTTIYLGRSVSTAGGQLVTAGQRILRTATGIPPGLRTWVARGLLGASLFIGRPERIGELIRSLNEFGQRMVGGAVEAIPTAIGNAMETLRQAITDSVGGRFAPLVYLIVLVGTGLGAVWLVLGGSWPRFGFAGGARPGGDSSRSR